MIRAVPSGVIMETRLRVPPEISIFASAAAGTMSAAVSAVIARIEKDAHCIRTSPIGPTTEGRVISE
jgi:hypothetical protein